jgi:hypothetical protein
MDGTATLTIVESTMIRATARLIPIRPIQRLRPAAGEVVVMVTSRAEVFRKPYYTEGSMT